MPRSGRGRLGGIAAIIGHSRKGGRGRVSWRWIFAFNVPLVIGTILLVLAVVPQTAPNVGRRIDLIGAALGAPGSPASFFALIEQPHRRGAAREIGDPTRWRRRVPWLVHLYEHRERLLKLDLFREAQVSAADTAISETLAMYAAIAILFF